MKLLRCKVCCGEIDIIGTNKSILKRIKCKKCGFNNFKQFAENKPKKSTEVIVLKNN